MTWTIQMIKKAMKWSTMRCLPWTINIIPARRKVTDSAIHCQKVTASTIPSSLQLKKNTRKENFKWFKRLLRTNLLSQLGFLQMGFYVNIAKENFQIFTFFVLEMLFSIIKWMHYLCVSSSQWQLFQSDIFQEGCFQQSSQQIKRYCMPIFQLGFLLGRDSRQIRLLIGHSLQQQSNHSQRIPHIDQDSNVKTFVYRLVNTGLGKMIVLLQKQFDKPLRMRQVSEMIVNCLYIVFLLSLVNNCYKWNVSSEKYHYSRLWIRHTLIL